MKDKLERLEKRCMKEIDRLYGNTDLYYYEVFITPNPNDRYLVIKFAVINPENPKYLCWQARAEVRLSKRGNVIYATRIPSNEKHGYRKDGTFDDGVRYIDHPANLKQTLEKLENYRQHYLRTGYRMLLNENIEQALDYLPG